MLITQAIKYLSNTGKVRLYVSIFLIPLIMGVINSTAIAIISSESKNPDEISYYHQAIVVVILAKFIDPLISTLTKKQKYSIIKEIKAQHRKQYLEKYNNLSFQSKNEARYTDFSWLLDDSLHGLEFVIDHHFNDFIGLMTITINCFILFWSNDAVYILLILIVVNLIIYKFRYSKEITKALANHKKNRELIKENKSMLSLVGELFHSTQKTVKDVTKIYKNIDKANVSMHLSWDDLYNTINYVNAGCCMILCYVKYDNIINMPMLLLIFNMFCSNMSRSVTFATDYEYFESKYDLLLKFFENKEFCPLAEQYPLPDLLLIKNVYVKRDNIEVKLANGLNTMELQRNGGRYLLVGKSGHGKSTFLNALIGKIDGIIMNKHKPENYIESFVEMPQNIKENLPTSNITVRQLFNDEPDSKLIIKCLEICCVDDKILSLRDKNQVSIVLETSSEPEYECLDVAIKERISGGEKTRLAIATRLYYLYKQCETKTALILDEPEQGSDPVIAYKIIGNILTAFPEICIIVVSHLELIQQKFKWNKIYQVERGIINEIN